MAKHRLKMLPLNLLALVGLMAWSASAASSSPSSSSSSSPSSSSSLSSSPPSAGGSAPSSPSLSAEVELICHTDNPAECYPKVFQATDEFQVVHDDQDLPMGLHVRLNINTGQKEAKINVPDEDNPALEGLPVDSSMVIVEREDGEETAGREEKIRIPANAPAYDPAGKIKKPTTGGPGDGNDSAAAFYKSLTVLKKGLDVDAALEMLEEISHDIYYGLKIAEDYETVRELFCLSTTSPSSFSSSSEEQQRQKQQRQHETRARLASLTLASTVQNNPKALSEITRHWPALAAYTCPPSSSSSASSSSPRDPLGVATFRLVPQTSTPSVLKTRIASLSGLLKSPVIRADFLASHGPSYLLRVLTAEQEEEGKEAGENEWAPAQRTAAFLLLDNFLDQDMGAALGEWPTAEQASDKHCGEQQGRWVDDGQEGGGEKCWDWHVKGLSEKFKKDKGHWSHELRKRVGAQRRANLERLKGKGKAKEEL